MRELILSAITVGLLIGCAAEKTGESADGSATVATGTEVPAASEGTGEPVPADTVATANENQLLGTWAGQIKVGQPVSMFNYVGAESGDFAPMRFRNDSDAGKKILAVCADGDLCEFTGAIEWLDEIPPPNASAIGQILTVDTVKRLPPEAP